MTRPWVGTIIRLVLAALLPFCAIGGIRTTAHYLMQPRATARLRSIEHFSDYSRSRSAEGRRRINAAREVWTGIPGGSKRWFNDLQVLPTALVVAADQRVIVLDREDGRVQRELSAAELGIRGPITTIGRSDRRNAVWLYSFTTGQTVEYEVAQGSGRRLNLPSSLLSLSALNARRVVATGVFERGAARSYLVDWQGSPVGAMEVSRGAEEQGPYPGLPTWLSEQLNMGTLAVAPDASKYAVAFRWNDRINIYNASTTQLQRSVAGPVATKLDFAVSKIDKRDLFSLAPESAYSYIDIAATDDTIVGLYSGREKRNFPSQFGLGAELHLFTWDGRLVARAELPEAVQKIRWDAETNTLYCLRSQPRPSVIAFDVRSLATRTDADELGKPLPIAAR